jgi:hypothetical protein
LAVRSNCSGEMTRFNRLTKLQSGQKFEHTLSSVRELSTKTLQYQKHEAARDGPGAQGHGVWRVADCHGDGGRGGRKPVYKGLTGLCNISRREVYVA